MAEIIHFFLLIVCFQITTEIPIKAVTFCYKADGSTALTWKAAYSPRFVPQISVVFLLTNLTFSIAVTLLLPHY